MSSERQHTRLRSVLYSMNWILLETQRKLLERMENRAPGEQRKKLNTGDIAAKVSRMNCAI